MPPSPVTGSMREACEGCEGGGEGCEGCEGCEGERVKIFPAHANRLMYMYLHVGSKCTLGLFWDN